MKAIQAGCSHHRTLPARRPSGGLWQLTRDERVQAMRAGRMPLWLCLHWSSRAPHEIPLIGSEWEFIAIFTPEVAESDDAQPSQRERVTESLVRCPGGDESARG